jgi:hypothetical protein
VPPSSPRKHDGITTDRDHPTLFRPGSEIEALFRRELERELKFYVHSAYEDAPWSSSVLGVAAQEAEAYKVIRRSDRQLGLTDRDPAELVARGLGDDLGPPTEAARMLVSGHDSPVVVPIASPSAESQFRVYDARPFSAVIGDVLVDLKADGIWKGDLKQQRRIMGTFAWITATSRLALIRTSTRQRSRRVFSSFLPASTTAR